MQSYDGFRSIGFSGRLDLIAQSRKFFRDELHGMQIAEGVLKDEQAGFADTAAQA